MKKGYLYTAVTVLMFLTVFTMALYFLASHSRDVASQISAAKTQSMFADIARDIEEVTGPKVTIEDGAQLSIRFEESLPAAANLSASYQAYKEFLEVAPPLAILMEA